MIKIILCVLILVVLIVYFLYYNSNNYVNNNDNIIIRSGGDDKSSEMFTVSPNGSISFQDTIIEYDTFGSSISFKLRKCVQKIFERMVQNKDKLHDDPRTCPYKRMIFKIKDKTIGFCGDSEKNEDMEKLETIIKPKQINNKENDMKIFESMCDALLDFTPKFPETDLSLLFMVILFSSIMCHSLDQNKCAFIKKFF